MFDFPYTEPSIVTTGYYILCFLVVWRCNYSSLLTARNSFRKISKKRFWIVVMGLIVCTAGLSGDFFSYMHDVHNYSFVRGEVNYMEKIYGIFVAFANKNYLLFRLQIWGGAYILFCLTAKRMNVNVYNAALYLFLTHCVVFGYGRVTASMAIYFFGLSFFCRPLKTSHILSYAIGISLLLISLQFHTSAYIMVIMTLMIFVPLTRWSFILSLCAMPLLVWGFTSFFSSFNFEALGNERLLTKLTSYQKMQNSELGFAALLSNTLQYASRYIPVWFIAKGITDPKTRVRLGRPIVMMSKVLFGIIMSATCFFFMGEAFQVFAYRVLSMSMIPTCIVVVEMYRQKVLSQKHFKWCLWSGIYAILYMMLYNLYLVYLES